jgi:antibiotic biosynthesis monooxygenase (ABM) superfamily enzyme
LPVSDRPEQATVVSIIHPPADLAAFDSWVKFLIENAEASSGFVTASVSVRESPELEPAVAATFESVGAAENWLDSAARREVAHRGHALGIWAALPDVLLARDAPLPNGLGAVDHTVAIGSEQQFANAQHALTAAAARAAGYQGTTLFPPGGRGDWLSVIRFRTDRQLADWMTSAERSAALPRLRSALAKDFSVVSQTTAFGTTVRVEDGRTRMTPGWKSAMLVLLVLYPTVMLLSRFLGPVLDGWGAAPWLALWLSQVVSIVLLQWYLMPLASRAFRRWLDPIDGAKPAVSMRGALVVAMLYLVTLALFASVTWLQYWDYQ